MPLPADKTAARELILRWTLNDAHAADFLMQIGEIARLADNIVDKDEGRQQNVCLLLSRCLTVLPLNPFYLRFAGALGPIMNEAIVAWQISDEWRVSGDPRKQTFGFVIRESTDKIVTAVASILGGYDHAKAVALELFEVCHSGSAETVETWVKE